MSSPGAAPRKFKFIRGNYWVFGKRVKHPGTKPSPFMGPAAEFAAERLMANMSAALNEAVKQA